MAKKKKHKKRSFDAASAAGGQNRPTVNSPATAPLTAAQAALAGAATSAQPAHASTTGRSAGASAAVDPRWGYMGRDVRRVALMAVICVVLEVILAYIFNHTAAGTSVYHLLGQ